MIIKFKNMPKTFNIFQTKKRFQNLKTRFLFKLIFSKITDSSKKRLQIQHIKF